MKLFLIGSCLLLLCITVGSAERSNSTFKKTTSLKETEKFAYPKKANTIKKPILKASLKKVADITDKFKDLPADDLAFIKELDKQFKIHGGKVKIKVENKNATEGKNNKRTIDGELGYGYAHNGYQYDPPKYMFYPYSQHDIGGTDSSYIPTGDGKTEVSIEPSYSYELKTQSYVTNNEPQIDVPKINLQQHNNNFNQKQQHYEEPVIVLRIPGPAKYATHLQMLLQKYLEIRAAQYLHILEEAEHRNLHPQHQLEQIDYDHGQAALAERPMNHVEQQQIPEQHDYQQHDHQNVAISQYMQYPEVDDVYNSYKHRHPPHHEQSQVALQGTQTYYASQQNVEEQISPQQHPQYQQEDQQQYQQEQYPYHQHVQQQPQYYYTHQQQYAQPESIPAHDYHQVYLIPVMQQEPVDHDSSEAHQQHQQPVYVQHQKSQNEHSPSLPVAENNPRPSHTKVVFTNKNKQSIHEYQILQIPSIKPNERLAPTSKPDYHQDFQQQQNHYNAAADSAMPEVVAITQRPYNYHARGVKPRARGRTAHTRRATRAEEAEKGLEKIQDFVRDNLGAETGNAVEFKTTQVING